MSGSKENFSYKCTLYDTIETVTRPHLVVREERREQEGAREPDVGDVVLLARGGRKGQQAGEENDGEE